MPVQWVNRPNHDFRGFSGRILGGSVRAGRCDSRAAVGADVDHRAHRDASMATSMRPLPDSRSTLTLADEVDVSPRRRDLQRRRSGGVGRPVRGHRRSGWPMRRCCPAAPYLVKLGATTVGASFGQPKYVVDVNSLEHLAAKTLDLNGIGVCNLTLDRAVAFDAYADNRDMGSFIVIDRFTNQTVGAGHAALRAAALSEHPLAGSRGRQAGRVRARTATNRACSGSPACRAAASRRSRTSSSASCMRLARAPICWTATTCVMV